MSSRCSKYIVLTQINENLGQGGRCVLILRLLLCHAHDLDSADMVCHWEDTDVVAQEMYSNVSHSNSLSYNFLTVLDWPRTP